jgi:hypothetical protein
MASPTVGMDGMLYGVTPGAGNRLGQVIWRMGLDGSNVTPLFHDTGATDGLLNDVPALFQASDGNFYFTVAAPCCSGRIMQMTPSGVLTNFHTFGGFAGDRLTQGQDGLLYGVGNACCTGIGGEVWSTSVNNAFNVVLNLSAATTGGGRHGPMQTPDGNLRMITSATNAGTAGNLLTIDTSGNILQVAPVPIQVGNNPNSQLLVGQDGKLYGTSSTGGVLPTGANSNGGTVYSIALTPPAGPIVNLPAPIRVIDTRQLGGGPIAAGQSRCFGVAGVPGIPADAGAVVLNVTAVGYGTNGWLTVYPNGQGVPATSTLNFDVHEYAMANGAIMRVGSNGQVCVNVGTVGNVPGSAQVILDATGYLTADDLVLLPMLTQPQRVVDTRASGGPVAAGQSRCFTLAGVTGVPGDAAAVVLNVTAVGYAKQGWLTAYPNGQAVPATSTLNFDTTEYAIANGSIVRIGSNGEVCVSVGSVGNVAGDSHIVLDVTGYLTANGLAAMPMLASPQRLVDTRASGGPIAAGQSGCFSLAGVGGVPAGATAVIVNVTAVEYGRQGWLTAYPAGQTVPATSTLNFDTTEYAMANGAVMAIGPGGQVCVNVGTVGSLPGTSHVILDVVGYM